MRTLTRSELTGRSDSELHALTAHFIKAMEQARPLSPEWVFCQHTVDSVLAERRRRLKRVQPRFF